MVAAAKRMREGGVDRMQQVSNATIRTQLFHRHVVTWAQQTMGQQVEWANRARRAAGIKREALDQEVSALSAELDILDTRIVEEQVGTKPLCMSAAAFTEEDVGIVPAPLP